MHPLYWFAGIIAFTLSAILMAKHFALIKKHSLNFEVIQVMYVCHICQQFAASIFLLLDNTANAAPEYFLACALTALLIPIGGLIGNATLPVAETRRNLFRRSPVSNDPNVRRSTYNFFFVLFTSCLAAFIFNIWFQRTMPLRMLVTGVGMSDPEALSIARRDAVGLGRFFGIVRVFYMPLLFMLGAMGMSYFKFRASKLLSLVSVGMALIYNAWAANKTPVAMLFLCLVLILLLKNEEWIRTAHLPQVQSVLKKAAIRNRRRIYSYIFLFVLLMISYPFFVFLLLPVSINGIGYLTSQIFLRIVFKPAVNTYMAFEAFASSLSYTHFADIKMVADLFGERYLPLSMEIAIYRGMDSFVTAPPAAIGNFYAQGGWIVLVVGVAFAAALFKIIENILYRARVKTLVHLTLYTLLLYGAFRFSWANFHTILATETMTPLISTLVFWNCFIRRSVDRRPLTVQPGTSR